MSILNQKNLWPTLIYQFEHLGHPKQPYLSVHWHWNPLTFFDFWGVVFLVKLLPSTALGCENRKFNFLRLFKGRYFSESMMHFSNCPKNVPKTILNKSIWNCVFAHQAVYFSSIKVFQNWTIGWYKYINLNKFILK